MLGPTAPDVSIEAVGFHYCKSWVHKFEMAAMLETDPSETLNEIIYCTRKASCPLLCMPISGCPLLCIAILDTMEIPLMPASFSSCSDYIWPNQV